MSSYMLNKGKETGREGGRGRRKERRENGNACGEGATLH
jgi:hypothetical protein